MIGYRKTSRRLFLGGAGAMVALPFLHSALPRVARAATPPAPTRFLGYYVPCGIRMEHWTPTKVGTGYDLPPILTSLKDLQAKVSVISKLANRPARPDGPGDHASGTGAFLTASHPRKTEGADIQNNISLDQELASKLGDATTLPSLQLGIDGGSSAGGCDSGYSCAYARNVSWAGPSTPLPKLTDPGTVFDRLFAGVDPQASKQEQLRRQARSKSVLDYVLSDAGSLSTRLGRTDKQKVDEYMNGVRELEKRIADVSQGPTCDPGMRPGSDFTYPEQVKLMSDLMVLSFQCDVTRYITFMLGNGGSNRSYDFLGVTGGHHEISHHQGNIDQLNKLTVIDTWEVEQLTYLLTAMDKIEDGDGTLLDHSAVFFSSEIEDGDTHSHFNMPILLAGSAGGAFKTGQHLVYDTEPSVGQLFVSILQACGLKDAKFGDDGDAALTGLT